MRNFILISSDPCFISDRIREIDKHYFIVFNRSKGRFEVHATGQLGGTYCFTLPFDELDDRTLWYTLKTQSQNVDKLIKELDKENEKLQKDNIKKAVSRLEEVLL